MIIPMSAGLESDLMIPFCTRKAVAPPLAIWLIVSSVSSRPGIGPTASEWSIGMQSILPLALSWRAGRPYPIPTAITRCILPSPSAPP